MNEVLEPKEKIMKDNETEKERETLSEQVKAEEKESAEASVPEITDKERTDEYLEHLQRLQAEFANYRKRVEKEKLEFAGLVKGELVKNLLPVIDAFDRFLENHNPDNNTIGQGIKLIYDKLITTLKEEGLEFIETVGRDFDPTLHEAISIEEVSDEKDGKILEEWQKGYLFKGRLLRAARVKVGKLRGETSASKSGDG